MHNNALDCLFTSAQPNAHDYRHGMKPAVAMISNKFAFKFLNIDDAMSIRDGWSILVSKLVTQ